MDESQEERRGDTTDGGDGKNEGQLDQVLGKLKKGLGHAGGTVSGLAGRLKAKLAKNKAA
jgi:uncharacterized protein YjbJ (UPF0337 family)